jgi:hypothetical protein
MGGDLVVAGEFTALSTGAPLGHIAARDGLVWKQLGDGLDNDVYCLHEDYNSLYAGGRFFDDAGNPTFGLAKYHSGTWQDLIDHAYVEIDQTDEAVHVISIDYNNRFWIGGRFAVNTMMYYGSHLAQVMETGNYIVPLGSFSDRVRTINSYPTYVGGDFTGHIVSEESASPAGVTLEARQMSVFPNPMSSSATIAISSGIPDDMVVQLHTVEGRAVNADYATAGNTITLLRGNLPPGMYLCTVTSSEATIVSGKLAVVD